MAAMRDVPDVARQKVAVGAWHRLPYRSLCNIKKLPLSVLRKPVIRPSVVKSSDCAGPTRYLIPISANRYLISERVSDCQRNGCRFGSEYAPVVDAMSNATYDDLVSSVDRPLVWLEGEIKTPPFSAVTRLEAGFLLRQLQQGKTLGMPHSRPMPNVGARCHELRINDARATWRIVYRIDSDAIIILEVFSKKTQQTP